MIDQLQVHNYISSIVKENINGLHVHFSNKIQTVDPLTLQKFLFQ
jgi:hypothetical protein